MRPTLDDQDTARLSTRADVPPEMLRALQALKAEGPSRRSMELVAGRLGDLLDAPPPAAHAARWFWRGVGTRAVAFRVGIAALTIGTAATWLRPAGPESRSALERTPARVASEHDMPALAEAPAALPPTTEPLVAAPSAEGDSLLPSDLEHGRPAAGGELAVSAARSDADSNERSGHRGRSLPTRGAATRFDGRRARGNVASSAASARALAISDAEGASSGRPTAQPASARDEQSAPPAPAHAEVVAPTPDAGLAPVTAEAPAPRQPNEVELMLDARRLAARDPKSAQRLLDQHAARFPQGVLAPEREVLAIEVLRALGQTAAAEQRLKAFRARYPNSMHLPRLSAPPATR
jgi:hypothetical protein